MPDVLPDIERRQAVARENAMIWAMRTAQIGEDPCAILARAALYTEFVLGTDGVLALKAFPPILNRSAQCADHFR
jgi:hypothetical protein